MSKLSICRGVALLLRLPPRLHPGITQEVAPNESRRGPNATRSLVQIQPRQPFDSRGWRRQQPLTPFVNPDFTQESVRRRVWLQHEARAIRSPDPPVPAATVGSSG